MARDQKRVKLEDPETKEEEVGEPNTITTGVDRFSQLPDSIICEILSSLPTIEAVRMSILSKRWRRI
ncbi:F-box domain containing protein [Parasponia andersonii]|uniref:F-box domain containing protein n=1 Tax=Parasponia andersonii TaxID=3476 RepID=A0A2P5ARW0_PARAD|nr:F-box domain containing protein [Parasponia andersonii]